MVAVLDVPSPLILVVGQVLDHGFLSLVAQVLVRRRRPFVLLEQGRVCRLWLAFWPELAL